MTRLWITISGDIVWLIGVIIRVDLLLQQATTTL